MTSQIIEWAPFSLAPGVDEAELVQASKTFQADFLDKQHGFLRRELIKDEKNAEYVDVVWWQSLEAASQAMKTAETSQACHTYFSVMGGNNDPGAGVRHFESVGTF